MAKLLSNSFEDERIPDNYVFPPEKRPGELVVPMGKANIPIVDLNDEESNTIHHIMKVSQHFGLFQVVNHEISAELMTEVMKVSKEVFKLPPEEQSKINMEDDTNKICRIYTSTYNYENEKIHYWRDALRHSCNPLEECIKYWPQKPENYRETVGPFVIALRDLGSRILGLISKGLGLGSKYFTKELSGDCSLTINHYPPCPNPSLTLGITKHTDPSLISILLMGDVPGLQVQMDDGQWMGVEALPNALLVIIGNQVEVVSNGRLTAGIHRAVTNAEEARTSAVFFINPTMSCIVEPAKALVEAQNGEPLYKAFQYKDFFKAYTDASSGDIAAVLEAFKIRNS